MIHENKSLDKTIEVLNEKIDLHFMFKVTEGSTFIEKCVENPWFFLSNLARIYDSKKLSYDPITFTPYIVNGIYTVLTSGHSLILEGEYKKPRIAENDIIIDAIIYYEVFCDWVINVLTYKNSIIDDSEKPEWFDTLREKALKNFAELTFIIPYADGEIEKYSEQVEDPIKMLNYLSMTRGYTLGLKEKLETIYDSLIYTLCHDENIGSEIFPLFRSQCLTLDEIMDKIKKSAGGLNNIARFIEFLSNGGRCISTPLLTNNNYTKKQDYINSNTWTANPIKHIVISLESDFNSHLDELYLISNTCDKSGGSWIVVLSTINTFVNSRASSLFMNNFVKTFDESVYKLLDQKKNNDIYKNADL